MGDSPRRRPLGKIIAIIAAAALACAAGVLLCLEGPLWWELSHAAAETLDDASDWRAARLHIDVEATLKRYTPQQLARYLNSPAEKWRGVICLALQAHSDKTPAHWTGIPSALARAARSTGNEKLAMLCFDALCSAPEYSATDVGSIVEAMAAKPTRDSDNVLEALASRSPQGRNDFKAAMRERLNGSFEPGQAAAFRILVRFFPEEDEAAAAYALRAFKGGGEQDPQTVVALNTLLSRRPAVGNQLLAGAAGDKRVLWLALARSPTNTTVEDPQLIAAAEQAAAASLSAPNRTDEDAIIRFLGGTPNGFSILFRGLADRDDQFIGKVLREFQSQFSPTRFPPTSFKGFTSSESETFVRLLPRLKGDQQRRTWETILGAAVRNRLPRNPFPQGAGPTDPRLADFLAAALDYDRMDSIIEYFEFVSPFAEKEVPRILRTLTKAIQRQAAAENARPRRPAAVAAQAAPSSTTPRSAGTLSPASPSLGGSGRERFAMLLLKRFPDRPDVKAFFAQYPSVLTQAKALMQRKS